MLARGSRPQQGPPRVVRVTPLHHGCCRDLLQGPPRGVAPATIRRPGEHPPAGGIVHEAVSFVVFPAVPVDGNRCDPGRLPRPHPAGCRLPSAAPAIVVDAGEQLGRRGAVDDPVADPRQTLGVGGVRQQVASRRAVASSNFRAAMRHSRARSPARASAVPRSRSSTIPCSRPSAIPCSRPSAIPCSRPSAIPCSRPSAIPCSRPSATPCSCPRRCRSRPSSSRSSRSHGVSLGPVPSRVPRARATRLIARSVAAEGTGSLNATWISAAVQPGEGDARRHRPVAAGVPDGGWSGRAPGPPGGTAT